MSKVEKKTVERSFKTEKKDGLKGNRTNFLGAGRKLDGKRKRGRTCRVQRKFYSLPFGPAVARVY